ncbi:hypothetical protein IFM89_010593, partial [Coptis chinensis]
EGSAVIRAYHLSRGCMTNTVLDLEVLHGLRLNTKTRRAPQVFECYWAAPPNGVMDQKTHAIVEDTSRALDMGWTHIWVESDYEATIKA